MPLFRSFVMSPCFDEEGGGGGTSAAAPASPASPGGNAAPPAPGAPGGSTGAPGSAATSAAPTGFTYKEDRSNWVPSHVIRQRTTELEKARQELEFHKRQVAALTGVKIETPRNPQHDAVRKEFLEVFPEMKGLVEKAERLGQLADVDLDRVTASADAVWTSRGNQVLQSFEEQVKSAYGGADLSPKAMQRITYAFVQEVASDPQMKARYEAGDMRIIGEFIKDYTEGVLDPYRRSTAAATTAPGPRAARNLPRGGGGSAITPARPAALKPSDPNFHTAAFERFSKG